MKAISLLSILFLLLLACSEEERNPVDAAITKACRKCALQESEMVWLRDLIESSRQDGSAKGDFYVVQKDSDQTIIIHQPLIMSCMACIQYDCHGNKFAVEDRLIFPYAEFNTVNRIYKLQPD